MYDIVIKNGKIYDGTGSPWYRGDVAVKDAKIAAVGHFGDIQADVVIDAENLAVAPGFIDMHCHSDMLLFPDEAEANQGKLLQGVTTELVGHCGMSLFPISKQHMDEYLSYLKKFAGPGAVLKDEWVPTDDKDDNWFTSDAAMKRVEELKMTKNCVSLVGHGMLRICAMGMSDALPDDTQMITMEELLEQALCAGAAGFSTGLIFPPCIFSDNEELRRLFAVTAKCGKTAHVHLRSESVQLEESVKEMLELAEVTGVRLHISHLRAIGRKNWGKTENVLKMIHAAREKGVDVGCDMYPYGAGNITLKNILPMWLDTGNVDDLQKLKSSSVRAQAKKDIYEGLPGWESIYQGAGWENICITICKNETYIGKSIKAMADERGDADPADTLFDLLLEDSGVWGSLFSFGEKDIYSVISDPLSVIGTDSLNDQHPRFAGTFVKVLGQMAREEKCFTMAEAVRKMTSATAARIGLTDRGIIRPEMKADIVIFNPEKVMDTATYAHPQGAPEGIEYVIVNGKTEVVNGQWNGEKAGGFIRI